MPYLSADVFRSTGGETANEEMLLVNALEHVDQGRGEGLLVVLVVGHGYLSDELSAWVELPQLALQKQNLAIGEFQQVTQDL